MRLRMITLTLSVMAFGAFLLATHAHAQKSSGQVNLNVMIESTTQISLESATNTGVAPATVPPVDGSGNLSPMITSDSGGRYEHGQPGVTAFFDRYGNLYFNWGQGGNTSRSVNFNYTFAYTANPTPRYGLPNGAQSSGGFKTHFDTTRNNLPLQNLSVGAWQCMMAGWDFKGTAGISWNNSFHRTNAQGTLTEYNTPKSAYVVVTCTRGVSGKCTAWEIQPLVTATNPCNSNTAADAPTAGVADVVSVTSTKTSTTYDAYGTYYLPFRLTLTKQ